MKCQLTVKKVGRPPVSQEPSETEDAILVTTYLENWGWLAGVIPYKWAWPVWVVPVMPVHVQGVWLTLSNPKFKDGDTLKTFDYVVANPPFSDKRWSNGIDPLHDPHDRFQPFGTPPGKQGDYAYLLHSGHAGIAQGLVDQVGDVLMVACFCGVLSKDEGHQTPPRTRFT